MTRFEGIWDAIVQHRKEYGDTDTAVAILLEISDWNVDHAPDELKEIVRLAKVCRNKKI